MLLRIWRFAAILFTSMSVVPAMAHLLEMPAKLRYDGQLWVTLQQSLYAPGFGTIGAFCEAAAVLTTAVLAAWVRHRGRTFAWTCAAALCMVVAHAIFWIWIAPVNDAVWAMSPNALAPNWIELRTRWEYSHAVRAILEATALAALVLSLLVEIPLDARQGFRSTAARKLPSM